MIEQPRPKSDFWRNCLIIGCVMAVLACVGVGLAGYFLYQKVGDSLTLDPAKVQERAQAILPGVKPPPGYKGQGAMDLFGFSMAFFGPSGKDTGKAGPGEADLIVMRLPKAPDLTLDKIREQMDSGLSQSQDEGSEKVLSEDPIELMVGGKPVRAVRRVVEESGQKKNEIYAAFMDKEQHLVMAVASGPSEGWDKAPVQAFFDSMNLKELQSIDPAKMEAEAPFTPSPAAP